MKINKDRKMYALINSWKTNPNSGPLYVEVISSNLEKLLELEDPPKSEVLLVYKDKEDEHWYFSRDFDNPIQTFKADNALKAYYM